MFHDLVDPEVERGVLSFEGHLAALDRRTSALGYSVLEPYSHYDPNSTRTTDRWNRWSLTPLMHKIAVDTTRRAPGRRRRRGPIKWWLQNGTAVRDEVKEHSLVFVAGAPNSGTSLLRTLISQPGLAHGQDSCVETTRCAKTNVEGQWLLRHSEWADSPVVTDVYKPGNLENHLTEKNATADALVTLWRLWARYWDMGRECLVEKSPANVGKIRWLAAVFAPAKRVRFLASSRRPTTRAGRPL